MAVFRDVDRKTRMPVDGEAAEALARKLASETGEPVKVYQRYPDYLVTTEPDPGSGWSCIFVAPAES
jgi:hypothetical protein